jgi:murein DD-endopeptidase MepM/ murein hydrolase activator NlpD
MPYLPSMYLVLCCLLASCSSAEKTKHIPYSVELKGHFTQGALIQGKISGGTRLLYSKANVFLNDQAIAVSKEGQFIFGFSKDAKLKHRLVIVYPNARQEIQALTLTKHHYNLQKIYGIDKVFTPSNPISEQAKKNRQRAKLDTQHVKAARALDTKINAAFSHFSWPLEGRITGVYGSQRFYNDKPGSAHYGIDIAGKTGTTVRAPNDGIISLAVPDMFYSGGTVIINHGFGLSSTFLHLSKLSVNAGDLIQKGQKLGEVGSTGRSTGPHLDWRINWYQMRLDPELIMFDTLHEHKHTSESNAKK